MKTKTKTKISNKQTIPPSSQPQASSEPSPSSPIADNPSSLTNPNPFGPLEETSAPPSCPHPPLSSLMPSNPIRRKSNKELRDEVVAKKMELETQQPLDSFGKSSGNNEKNTNQHSGKGPSSHQTNK